MRKVIFKIDDIEWFRRFYEVPEEDFKKVFEGKESFKVIFTLYGNGKTVEEYYFAACLAYAEENGFQQFLDEEDDGNIFEYCGSELIKNGDFKAVLV